ncbi:MAG: SurA N-terminal domain-containing protein, partial [Luminiphilus sp.]|nr:SurA N-terminal domain-containing protein [Luminiphilus sp.]
FNELQFAIEQQRRQLSEIYGDQLDPSMLDDDLLRPGVLNNLVDRALLEDYALSLGITASPEAVRRSITSNPTFEVDGSFSVDYYRDVLRSNGLTPDLYRAEQGSTDQLVKLESVIADADFITPVEAKAAIDVVVERRDVRFLVVPESALSSESQVTDQAVSEYYEVNAELFAQPERLSVEFIELNPSQFELPVDEAELEAQLADALADYETKAQSEVAHILLIQEDDETDEVYAGRIKAVADRLVADEDFAVVAADASDDIGSSFVGGDLGFTDGSVFPDAMEEAIADLDVGGVSSAVTTDAGTHFILVKSRSAAEQVPDDLLRAEITESLQTAQTQRDLLIAVDQLRDLVFMTSGLGSAAEQLGVSVSISQPFSRDEGLGLFNESSLRSAAFSDDVLVDGNNSDVIELSGSRFVALAVKERLPEGTRPLTEVRDGIAAQLSLEAQDLAMRTLVDEVNASLKNGETLESVSTAKGYEWRVELAATRQNVNLPSSVLQSAFSKRSADTETVSAVRLDDQSYALVQLARTQAGREDTMVGAERDALLQEVSDVSASLVRQEFMADLKRRGDVVIR